MIMKRAHQTGFAHLGILLAVLIVAVIAFAAFKLEQSRGGESASITNPPRSQQASSIKTKTDLEAAEKTLNSADVDGDLSPSSFDQDVSYLQ